MLLDRLIARALAIPPPLKRPVTTKKTKALGARYGRATRCPGHRRYARYQMKPPTPPPRPYAALRWPPLRITVAALKAGNTTQQPQRPQQDQQTPQQPQKLRGSREGAPLASLEDLEAESPRLGSLLELAELFEDKLSIVRHKRHIGGGQRERKNRASAAAPTAPSERMHPLGYRVKESQQAPKRERGRQDYHRASGLSKCAANVADVWPYS